MKSESNAIEPVTPVTPEVSGEGPRLMQFSKLGDSSIGFITVAEGESIPFEIRRVYWTYYTPQDVQRGRHAHHHLRQILIAAAGTILIRTEMADGRSGQYPLDTPWTGLYMPPHCWHTMDFSHNAVLLCLASMEYSENDYIRDYQEFRRMGGRA
ncbi:MAG: dTDP-6-deoxy-3,4-keto-hexulose isomerase [Chlorobi bacterium]|nr:dTDP-6-deoxy-3,4-keto-hexulose isomerase [Chlorobiota bacterium]